MTWRYGGLNETSLGAIPDCWAENNCFPLQIRWLRYSLSAPVIVILIVALAEELLALLILRQP